MGNQRSAGKPARSRLSVSVQSRYVDAYRVAGTLNWFGQAIKLAGFVLAWVVFARVAEAFQSPSAGVVAALLVGSFFLVIGVIVAAQGQLMKSTIDTAVNSSPFLSDLQKAAAMSLSTSTSDAAPTATSPEASGGVRPDEVQNESAHESEDGEQEDGSSPFCYHCGANLPIDTTICTACGKRL